MLFRRFVLSRPPAYALLCAIGLMLALLAPAQSFAQASVAAAKPGEVRLLASTGLRAVLESLHGGLEAALGRKVVIQFGASRALKDVIESGQPFDVAIVTPEVLESGIAKGAVRAGSRQDLARTLAALAQRGGRPRDISTPETLKATLLGAKAIRFNPIGSGRPTIDKMFAGLGIDPATLGARIRPLPTPQDPPAALGTGEYELSIVLDSEVRDLVAGAANLGPIPSPFQVPVVMSAGLGAKGDAGAGLALIDYLKGADTTRALAANRMSRVAAAPAQPFDITSSSFKDGAMMALKYSGSRKESAYCLGSNVSPELRWRNIPAGTKSLALYLQDPEGRLGLGVIHWIAYGISPARTGFAEGEVSVANDKYLAGKGWYEGQTIYIGPCPPQTSATHHYIFTVIATDLAPDALPAGLTLAELMARLDGHVKGAASIVGLFKHPLAP